MINVLSGFVVFGSVSFSIYCKVENMYTTMGVWLESGLEQFFVTQDVRAVGEVGGGAGEELLEAQLRLVDLELPGVDLVVVAQGTRLVLLVATEMNIVNSFRYFFSNLLYQDGMSLF